MNDASRRQREAADPGSSTWLSANAGSGKTRVLTDRVARLLLSGAAPQNILCLTYTKAAASEMQNRLFATLGDWAMLDEAELRAKLVEIGVDAPADLELPRTLFARAIETPGGLRIQTIHAFCAALLRRFPLEAGVSPAFNEIDESGQAKLVAELLDEMAAGSAQAEIDAVVRHGAADLEKLAKDVLAVRESLGQPASPESIRASLGIPAGLDRAALVTSTLGPAAAELLAHVRDLCAGGCSSNDQKIAAKLAALNLDAMTCDDFEALESFMLFQSGEKTLQSKRGTIPTKTTRARLGNAVEAFDDLMDRVADARPLRLALAQVERTAALCAFAAAFLPRYEERKALSGWLDYDDLILKARRLLSDPAVADWVLYRLDGGVDHILVDEAQDTSPDQWQVIEQLAREFAAGRGARDDLKRTIFVVGDVKQSIYSFQGADPAEFERMAEAFRARLPDGLQRLELIHSFRSSRAILEAVDEVSRNLPGLDPPAARHDAFYPELPGRVDLWPLVPRPEKAEKGHWSDPVDLAVLNAPEVTLAKRLARWLRERIKGGEPVHDQDGKLRPMRAGDVLILVQRRDKVFRHIISALKAEGLPVSGPDRLRLLDVLAVRDVLALMSFLALPEDDLSLATALRSPLFGWSEGELYDLAHGRDGYLWATLRAKRDHEATRATLDDLRRRADFDRPYELLERILLRHGGRGRLIARLGPEAEDGIDELLNRALAYERTEAPSLTGFLAWIMSENVDVKRQPDAEGDRVRVMTVHGAKGLESPMLILPDTIRADPRIRDDILIANGAPHWRPTREAEPPSLAAARADSVEAESRERDRLLYVAMTRARTWLVVCGAGDGGTSGSHWHGRVAAALAELGGPFAFPTGDGLRLERGSWSGAVEPRRDAPPAPLQVAPDRLAPPHPARPEPLHPSDLGGAKALPGEGLDEAEAKARGTRLHLLLEHLPGVDPAERAALAEALLGGPDPELVAEAEAVIDAPDLARIFSDEALAEVEFSATLPELGGRSLRGAIDRLILSGDRVLCVDFKSNRVVPASAEAVPSGLLRQMGAYAAALAQIYPDRAIETAILWTRAASLMPLPDALVRSALLDAAQGGP